MNTPPLSLSVQSHVAVFTRLLIENKGQEFQKELAQLPADLQVDVVVKLKEAMPSNQLIAALEVANRNVGGGGSRELHAAPPVIPRTLEAEASVNATAALTQEDLKNKGNLCLKEKTNKAVARKFYEQAIEMNNATPTAAVCHSNWAQISQKESISLLEAARWHTEKALLLFSCFKPEDFPENFKKKNAERLETIKSDLKIRLIKEVENFLSSKEDPTSYPNMKSNGANIRELMASFRQNIGKVGRQKSALHGDGLFALERLDSEQVIALYAGYTVDENESPGGSGHPYAYDCGDEKIIGSRKLLAPLSGCIANDGAFTSEGAGILAELSLPTSKTRESHLLEMKEVLNRFFKLYAYNLKNCNAGLEARNNIAVVVAEKHLIQGEEVLVSYGPLYWISNYLVELRQKGWAKFSDQLFVFSFTLLKQIGYRADVCDPTEGLVDFQDALEKETPLVEEDCLATLSCMLSLDGQTSISTKYEHRYEVLIRGLLTSAQEYDQTEKNNMPHFINPFLAQMIIDRSYFDIQRGGKEIKAREDFERVFLFTWE